jgi:hypothetical protein
MNEGLNLIISLNRCFKLVFIFFCTKHCDKVVVCEANELSFLPRAISMKKKIQIELRKVKSRRDAFKKPDFSLCQILLCDEIVFNVANGN